MCGIFEVLINIVFLDKPFFFKFLHYDKNDSAYYDAPEHKGYRMPTLVRQQEMYDWQHKCLVLVSFRDYDK